MPRPVTIVNYDPRWPIVFEEEKQQIEEEKAQEEKRNLTREMAESLPKFLINTLVVIAVAIIYWFVTITTFFSVLDLFPLLSVTIDTTTIVSLTGYAILRVGLILVIIFFGVEAVKELV